MIGLIVAPAAGEQVAPGVTFTRYNAPGPNIVHVVAFDRLRSEYKLKIGWPQKRRNFTARARTSAIAGLYHAPPDHAVLAAVNASFFSAEPPGITGTAASDGQILEQPSGSSQTFLFGPSRRPVIRANISHQPGTLTFASGTTTAIGFYNRLNPPIHNVTAYTPDWGPTTGTDFSSAAGLWVEVILTDVTYPMRGHKEVSGIVSQIRTSGTPAGNSAIPAGGMVLSAWGSSQTTILANTQVGHRLRMRFVTGTTDYNNADMAITGNGWLVNNGAPNTGNWSQYSSSFAHSPHPRTVLAWNDDNLYMVVCDGRSSPSVGMTFSELADFLIGTLNAVGAVNLDGGGSSTMVVSGVVRNTPSDGSERNVANAVLLVREPTFTAFPFTDAFTTAGRLAGWDDKFTFNEVIPFSPAAPGGDGHVIRVADPTGGVETVRRGDFGDTDYSVEADVYCEYRPDVAADGSERYGIFARDSGTGAFGLSGFGGGNCYAMTYNSNNGRLRAGRYVEGTFTDFLASQPILLPQSAWRRFGIDCYGPTITYRLDGEVIAEVNDTTHVRGQFGIGYRESFDNNNNIRGTRADNFTAFVIPPIPGDMDGDEDVDQEDFGLFQACYSGPFVPYAPGCELADLDADGDIDQDDFTRFHRCMTGPNILGDPFCTN